MRFERTAHRREPALFDIPVARKDLPPSLFSPHTENVPAVLMVLGAVGIVSGIAIASQRGPIGARVTSWSPLVRRAKASGRVTAEELRRQGGLLGAAFGGLVVIVGLALFIAGIARA